MQITFDIDPAEQNLNTTNYFPQIELLYDGQTGKVTVSFLYIQSLDNQLRDALETIDGVSDVAVTGNGLIPKGTMVSFSLDEGYDLYGEVVSKEDYTETDHLALWTEERG